MCTGGRVPARKAGARISLESALALGQKRARGAAERILPSARHRGLASVLSFHGRVQTHIKLQRDLTLLSYSIRNIFQQNNSLFLCVYV